MDENINENKGHVNNGSVNFANLIGVLAHEIKNPLSTIKVNLKLIAEDLQKEAFSASKQGENLAVNRLLNKISVVQKETDRLEHILDGFLRYTDDAALTLSHIDINELMSDMVDFFGPQARSHSIIVRTFFAPEQLICKIDENMIKQVVLNIFLNAQQAMADGGELMIRTDRHGSDAVIQISDTGSGIAADKLEKIFDMYYSTKPDGAGLGLAIASRIIQKHKGSITVISEPGRGTAFTLKLPLKMQ